MKAPQTIVPLEALPHSVEAYLASTHRNTRIVYLILLGFVLATVVLLFVIRTDVNVRSNGIIKPTTERNEIRSATAGIIDSIFISENSEVKAGQPIVKIRTAVLEQKNQTVNDQHNDASRKIHDLQQLLSNNSGLLKTPVYQQQYRLYQQQLTGANNRYKLAKKNYDRFSYLYSKNAVSALELDKASFELQSAESERALVQTQQRSQWQNELNALQLQLGELGSQLEVNEEYKDQYTIRAQLDGRVQGLKGLQPGNSINPNEVIGEISPDTSMIAEVYVLPKDIGLIQVNQPLRMYVDAFNHTEWGDLSATVESISPDVFTTEGQPYFKVRCKLQETSLYLRNGYEGIVRKGMTVQARFWVARRTLFQLLYDEANDWLTPNTVSYEAVATKQ